MNVSHEVLLPKHIVAKQLEVSLLVIVNRDKDNPILRQQFTSQLQAGRHKHQPGRVCATATRGEVKDALCLILVDTQLPGQFLCCEAKLVVIDETIRAGIVGRVDIDAFHPSGIRLQQVFERIEIISLNFSMSKAPSAVKHPAKCSFSANNFFELGFTPLLSSTICLGEF